MGPSHNTSLSTSGEKATATGHTERQGCVRWPRPFSSWTPFFLGIVTFIGGVSAYDGYLVVRTGPMIRDFEQNPLGVYLLDCDNGDPSLFLRFKAAGTLLSLTGLSVLQSRSRRLAGPVAAGMAAFQFGLLLYLEIPFP